jgi:UDP-N-acetylmuramyl pentapeptide phosphotransferase/UDP-N-acetylglucosamine-1-phosphate transferase
MVVGLYDDVYNMDFKLKFIFQVIAAKIFIDNGLIIDNLHGVLGIFELSRIVAQLFTIFIIISIINSINFIDGVDGLAITIVLFFLIMFEFFSSEITPFFNLTVLVVASSLPLLYFNFKKNNKVFLGDSGSLLLGGIVSAYVIYILSQGYIIKPRYDIHKILFVLSILILPIVDIVRVFFIRIFNGKSPFEADKNHIHHILLKLTNSHILTTLSLLFFTLIFLIFIQIIS